MGDYGYKYLMIHLWFYRCKGKCIITKIFLNISNKLDIYLFSQNTSSFTTKIYILMNEIKNVSK